MKKEPIWKFVDNAGTFVAQNPQEISYLYLPLANEAEIMSSITPELKGDIKIDNNSFLLLPISRCDIPITTSSRNFWLYLKENKKTWSLAGSDKNNENDKVIVEAGLLYHKVTRINLKIGLEVEIINFVPVTQDRVELTLIRITNISRSILEITPTSAIPLFARSADNLRDHRHVSSLLNRITQEKFGITVSPAMSFDERGHKINKTSYFIYGVEVNNQAPLGSFPTQELFLGEGGNLNYPQCVIKNIAARKFSAAELSGKEAMAALRFRETKLKPKQSINYGLILGITETKQQIPKTFRKFDSINKIQSSLEKNKKYWKDKINNLIFETKDNNFDNWLQWVKLQPTLRKIFGCSFLPDFDYGRGGKGWRDLWQDCLALLLNDSKNIRPLLCSNFSGVRIDGTNATIITKKPGHFIADRNKISRVWMDHGLWPFFTLELYINQTGDFNILLEKAAYFRDAQIMRAKEIDTSTLLSVNPERSRRVDNSWNGDTNLKCKNKQIYKGTILEHILIEHLVQFFNVGKHNNIRLENADWNDGLDMATDKGESVAFSSFYAYNLSKIAELLEKLKELKKIQHIVILKEILILLDSLNKPIDYNSVSGKIKILNKYLNSTKLSVSGKTEKIKINSLINDLRCKANWLSNHIQTKEWINLGNLGFFNGYYDNKSRRVEGKHKRLVKMTLTGQIFPILSGIALDEQIKKIFKAAKKFLQDKKLGGFRLNTNFGKPQFNLGRAFAFSYGDKENGAIFSHMCVMFAYALYRRGFAKEGFEVLNSLYELAVNSRVSKIYPNLPEYFNLDGRGMYSYLTGSASWFIMTLLTQAFGIYGEYGNLVIEPKLTQEQFKVSIQICAECTFSNKRIRVEYFNPGKKDLPKYSIKQIKSPIVFQKISQNKILIKREKISSFKSHQINIKITLN